MFDPAVAIGGVLVLLAVLVLFIVVLLTILDLVGWAAESIQATWRKAKGQ